MGQSKLTSNGETSSKSIIIPYTPRPLQREVHNNLKRFNVLVCHRRFGKSVLSINQLIKTAKWQLLDKGQQCLDYPDDLEWITDSEKLIEETQKILIERSQNKFLDKTEADVKKFWEQKGGK